MKMNVWWKNDYVDEARPSRSLLGAYVMPISAGTGRRGARRRLGEAFEIQARVLDRR
jgi:hypothetical protein